MKHNLGRNLFRIARDNLGQALRMMIDKGQAIAAVPFVQNVETKARSEIIMVIVHEAEREDVVSAIVGALKPEYRGKPAPPAGEGLKNIIDDIERGRAPT